MKHLQKVTTFIVLVIFQSKLLGYTQEDLQNIPTKLSGEYHTVHQMSKVLEDLMQLREDVDSIGSGGIIQPTITIVATTGDAALAAAEDVIIEADPGSTATAPAGKAVITAGSVNFTGLTKGDVAIGAENDADLQAMGITTIQSIDKDIRIIADNDGSATGSDGTGDFGKIIMTAGPVNFTGLDKGDIAIGSENTTTIESLNGDVNICADTDTSSIGKVNIKSGTNTNAANGAGDIGISAENDLILKSNNGTIMFMGTVTGLGNIAGDNATVGSNNSGGDIIIAAGDGDGTASGGNTTLSGGNGGANGPGGNTSVTGGDAGAGSNDPGGNVAITGGNGDGTGNGGNIIIAGGTTGTGSTGSVDIDGSSVTIDSDDPAGDICIQADIGGIATAPHGSVKITAGNVSTSGIAANEIHIIADNDITISSISGIVNIEGLAVNNDTIIVDTSATGGIMGSNAAGGSNNPGGDIKVFSGKGDGTGAGGDVIIKAETSTSSGDDGNIRMLTGGLSFAPTLSNGDIGFKASGDIILEIGTPSGAGDANDIILTGATGGTSSGKGSDIEITAGNGGTGNGDGGNITLASGNGTGSGSDGDINIIGKDQNINLISLILHILKAARIQPQTTSGSICFSNLNNDGKSRATYDGITFTLTMDSDAGTLTITAPDALSAPSPAVLRLGDGVTSMTTTTGINMVSIQWLANGRIEATSAT